MSEGHGEKSRKERRKEARLDKQKNRFLSWVQHQSVKKKKPASPGLERICEDFSHEKLLGKSYMSESELSADKSVQKQKRKKTVLKKASKKTKFQEFLEMETNKDMEQDLEMERKLAKKLKVKGGKLGGFDDGINDLFDGLPSILDSRMTDDELMSDEEDEKIHRNVSSRKKGKNKKSSRSSAKESEDQVVFDALSNENKSILEAAEQSFVSHENPHIKAAPFAGTPKYVAPHLRACARNESEEIAHVRRRIRGLLNRLSESNVESITEDIANIFRSVPRSDGCQIIGEEVMFSCSNGPRGSEQHAAVFASFVAGMACLVGIDFSAKLLASLATAYETEYLKEDNLSLRNVTLLLSYLYIFGVCSSDLMYDFLSVLSKCLIDLNVTTILAVLQCCGMKLRADDPTAMKDFILSIQNRVSELKSSSGSSENAQPTTNNKRMDFMLEAICDIKNNKKRVKEDSAHHTRIKKWLQKLKSEEILLRGLKWSKLLDPGKKGQWWWSGEIASTENNTVREVAVSTDKEILEAQNLIQLAGAQRMNTDVRRAIFCIIMSGEDYLDAFEKILRLDLSGKQDREIMRVLVECCLQEKVFNKYYVVLASKLCSHDKNHKFTLQYCLWDHFKTLESMELIRSMNLAKFVAEMLSSFTLSLALLKTVDLTDPKQLTPKRIIHFRMLFETIFENADATIWNIFSRIAALPEHEVLSQSFDFFIKKFVISVGSGKSLAAKFKVAKKALNNVAGIRM